MVAKPAQISARGIEGPPLLVVEVLSPSSKKRDRKLKAARYAELGVPHCWIVDPEARTLECFRARSDAYELVIRGGGDCRLEHPGWDGLTLELAALWK